VWPETLLLVGVYALTVGLLVPILPESTLRWLAPAVHAARNPAHRTLAWWWYVLVAQPIFLVNVFRWLWQWALWGQVVVRMRHLHLHLQASHTDFAGGIGFLESPLWSFRFFAAALNAAMASVWFDEIGSGRAEPSTFASLLLWMLAINGAVAAGPYLALTPALVLSRRDGTHAYSILLRHFVDQFEHRWIVRGGAQRQMLGHADFSSMIDIADTIDLTHRMRTTVFSVMMVKQVLLWSMLPYVPLVLTYSVSIVELARRLFERLIGG